MKRISAVSPFLALLLAVGCAGKSGPDTKPGSSGISEVSVRSHMEFLASDALNGRASGSRDEWIAVNYVAAHIRRLGLEPLGDAGGYVQTIEMERPELGAPPVLTVGNQRFTHAKEITVVSMPAPRIAGTLSRHQKGAVASAGAAVIVTEPLAAVATELSAAAIILTGPDGCGPQTGPARGRLPRPAVRTVGVPPGPSRPSCVSFDAPTFEIINKLNAGTDVVLEAEVKTVQKTQTWNAVGRIVGSDPTLSKEVILLSAHIDHIGVRPNAPAGTDAINNGADDDASGSIAVLELADAIARGPRPKRTIVFAWFGSEEIGGAGSRYFADKPVVPLDQLIAMLQFEMIGRADEAVPPHTLWLTGYERSTLGPELARRGAKLVQDPHPKQNFFERSDNIAFARRGVIAHTVSSYGLHKEYHTPADEIGKIDFAHMTDAIRSMVEPIRWLANAPFKPAWNPGGRPQ